MIATAAFFAPLMVTSPQSRVSPCTINFSILTAFSARAKHFFKAAPRLHARPAGAKRNPCQKVVRRAEARGKQMRGKGAFQYI